MQCAVGEEDEVSELPNAQFISGLGHLQGELFSSDLA